MKIDYNPSLFKQIADLSVNDIVQVKNRKGIRKSIHITNIANLTWQQLQLLMPAGPDRFSKMFLLYQRYKAHTPENTANVAGTALTPIESREVQHYIQIFRENHFQEHTEVNNHITAGDMWDAFPTIRSLNDHGEYKHIPGIQPKYYEIICQLLSIWGNNGRPLDDFHKY